MACDIFAQDSHNFETDISEMRKKVNETEVEAELHIQYKERYLKGAQDCQAREYERIEHDLKERIERLRADLETEKAVNAAITSHLRGRKEEIMEKKKELDTRRDENATEIIEKEQKEV
jgi:hypothetical protein